MVTCEYVNVLTGYVSGYSNVQIIMRRPTLRKRSMPTTNLTSCHRSTTLVGMRQEVTRADVSDGLPLYRSNSIMRDDDLLDLVM